MGGQLFQSVGLEHRGLGYPVFVPQQMPDLIIKNLEGQPLRLGQQSPPVGYVGVVAEVGPFIQEPLSVQVDNEAKGIGVLLVQLRYDAVTEGRGVHVPGHGVAAAPVAVGLGSHIQRHADGVPGVVGDSANLHRFPARTQVPAAHLGVGFEAAGGQNHRPSVNILEPLRSQDLQAWQRGPQRRHRGQGKL